MKDKKGFTLIELLAVIIILALLMLLIIPKVTQTISDAEKNTNMTSAQNLVKAAQLKASNNEMTGNTENIKINYTTGENHNYIDYSGEKPESGQVSIKSNGQVAMAVRFDDYCYLKAYNSNDINILPYSDDTCNGNASVFTNYEMPELATTGDGLYEAKGEPGRFVYRGKNPNNYIYLKEDGVNNTLYRIISYENDGTIKVIRDASIGDIAWDKRDGNTNELKISGPRKNTDNTYCNYNGASAEYYGCNVWGTQSNTYYNDTTLININQDFFYKYFPDNTQDLQNLTNTGTVSKNSSLNEYLNHLIENESYWQSGETLDKYISEHAFNVGGIYYHTNYPSNKKKTFEKEKKEQNTYTWKGKIGLMNITEYVEASLNPTCTSVYSNYYYNSDYYYDTNADGKKDQTIQGYDNWPCSNRNYNWLPKGITEWSLSPYSASRYGVWSVRSGGTFDNGFACSTYGVRPAFYLKSSVKLGGFGTIDDPYYIIES